MNFLFKKGYTLYLLRFGGLFSVLYFGTLLTIGLSTPQNSYSPFVASYLNYTVPLRDIVLGGARVLLYALGYPAKMTDAYTIVSNGAAVKMVYSCLGYGILSFWAAFVIANTGAFYRKAKWLVGGGLALCGLNAVRVALLVVAGNKGWKIPLGIDHHTLFNIFAYLLIFLLIYLYDKSSPTNPHQNENGPVEIQQQLVQTR